MAAPTIYRSSDANAPTLTGTAGDLVNLLDKCLVTGYTGKSAAGWTRNTGFAGNTTTRAVFRQGAGNQFYLDVDDRGASGGLTSASGKEAAVRGYEAMTDVSTGTNPFPTTAQLAAATGNWRKSASADTVQRGWFLIADDRSFYLAILDGDTTAAYKIYFFGDIYSLKSADGFRTAITVRTSVNSASPAGSFFGQVFSNAVSSTMSGFYIVRNGAGSGTAINGSEVSLGTGIDTAGVFPAIDGNAYITRVIISDAATPYLRGWFRGVYSCITPVGLNDGDTFSGSGDLAGRTFVVLKGVNALTNPVVTFETTAWDTSS